MSKHFNFFLIFLNFLFSVLSILKEWNLEKSSLDLLSSSDSFPIILEETKDNLYVKLSKYIIREKDSIKYQKFFLLIEKNNVIYNGEVDFDDIGNFFKFNNEYIICPKGKYHPLSFYNNHYSTLSPNDFQSKGDWELKCIKIQNSQSTFFIVFYLMNGKSQFFYKNAQSIQWENQVLHQEIYDIKIIDELNVHLEYSTIYIVKNSEFLKLLGSRFTINKEGIFRNDCGGEIIISKTFNYTRGCFENNYDKFYFLSYDNISSFFSGYYDSTDSIEYLSVGQYQNEIKINSVSPFEFLDEVEIKEIKFIKNYKYAYYKIYNPTKNKTYYGIIDVKKNLVVFNTDIEIETFIPYTNISMLAITSSNAYEICIIKDNNICIDSNDCINSNYEYILDLEGNKCGNSCDNGKILLVKEKICIDSCDEEYYILVNNQCGLCKDFYPDKPYKLINTSQCFSESEIPIGTVIYNYNLNLLKCKQNYILKNEECIFNCFETCNNCSEFSDDISNQKCLWCKDNFTLVNGNCISVYSISTSLITNIPIINITNEIITYTYNSEFNISSSSNLLINETSYISNQLNSAISTNRIINIENLTENDSNIIESIINNINLTDIDNGIDKVIYENNLKLIFTSTFNQKINEDEKNITLNLGICENLLKNEYKIPIKNTLYILQYISEEKDMKIPKIEFEVYYPMDGNNFIKLNLTACKDIKIDISVRVFINDEIYKYNKSSDYYNDICFKYKSESNTDIILNDRRKEFIENNMNLCEEKCDLVDYNYNNKKAKCSCDIKLNLHIFDNIKLNKDKIFKSFTDLNSITNLHVMKCYKQTFNKSLKNNYGFFFIIFILLLYFICRFVFYFYSFDKLKELISDILSSLKKKNIEKNNKKVKFKNQKKALKIKIYNDDNKSLDNLKNSKKIKIKNKRNDFPHTSSFKKSKKLNESNMYKLKRPISTNNNNKVDTKSNIKKINIENDKNLSYKDFELNQLDYKEAIKLDKRSCIMLYLSLLKNNHSLIFSFSLYQDYNSKIIKFFSFFFFLSLDLTINALFFNDTTMHKIYEDKGKFNFIFQIPQIIYSSLISSIINSAIKLLSISQKNIIELKQEREKENENLDKIRNKLILKFKIKFTLFFILTFLFLLFFLYYISCFCCIYENTQIQLIEDTLISFALSLIYPFFIYLLPSLLRFKSLRDGKGGKEILYKLSNLF